jgi:hypothetical protein
MIFDVCNRNKRVRKGEQMIDAVLVFLFQMHPWDIFFLHTCLSFGSDEGDDVTGISLKGRTGRR